MRGVLETWSEKNKSFRIDGKWYTVQENAWDFRPREKRVKVAFDLNEDGEVKFIKQLPEEKQPENNTDVQVARSVAVKSLVPLFAERLEKANDAEMAVVLDELIEASEKIARWIMTGDKGGVTHVRAD